MRWLAWVAGALAIAGVASLLWLGQDPPARSERRFQLRSRGATAGSDPVPYDPAGVKPIAPPRKERGTVFGTLTFEDGGPAPEREIVVPGAGTAETDPAGSFEMELAKGRWEFVVDGMKLKEIRFDGGKKRVDLLLKRGPQLTGVVLDRRTRAPCQVVVSLRSPEGNAVAETSTDKAGQFVFPRVPPGTWGVVAHDVGASEGEGHETARRTVRIDEEAVAVEILLHPGRTFSLQIDNVPLPWNGIDYGIVVRDRSGQLPDHFWAGLDVGRTADPRRTAQPRVAPPPGRYQLLLMPPHATSPQHVWLLQELEVPEGNPPDVTVRLPDGVPVTLVMKEPPKAPMRIGPFPAAGIHTDPEDGDGARVTFPFVAVGRHEVWEGEKRLGEIDIPFGGPAVYDVTDVSSGTR